MKPLRPVALGPCIGWVLCVAASAATACAGEADLGGTWRGLAQLGPEGGDLVHGSEGGPVALELVIGEYGPDVAGLLRFFRGDSWLRARSAEAPDRECGCSLLHGGRVDASTAQAAFTLQGCLPGAADRARVRARGSLRRTTSGAVLVITVDEPGSPLHKRSSTIALEQTGGPGDIALADLACPTALPTGNTASGQ
ncbi:MAG: hypothetical protein FJ100_12835 [Deltaproteobacteria bacterium]|nr:hypothetical protein [Deltaproteobacteria bacterium]